MIIADAKITIRRVLVEELGFSPSDFFLMYSDAHKRFEVWVAGRPIYGSTTRAIIRAIRRSLRSKTKTTTAPVHAQE